jgi:hypothetical protein
MKRRVSPDASTTIWVCRTNSSAHYLMTSPTMNQARAAKATLYASATRQSRPHLVDLPWRINGGSPFCCLSHSNPNTLCPALGEGPPISQTVSQAGRSGEPTHRIGTLKLRAREAALTVN